MPVALAHLIANRAPARVDFGGGDVLSVEYYPAKLTGDMLVTFGAADRLASMSNDDALATLTAATDMLLTLLASWDLVDEAGAVLPIDRDTLDALGLQLQWRILTGMMASSGAGMPGEAAAPQS